MGVATFDRSLVQRQEALVHANAIRSEGALVRGELRSLPHLESCRRAAVLLEEPSDAVGAMRVGHLLSAIRHAGVGKVGAWLNIVGVRSWDRRVRDLSPRQRLGLVRVLCDRADRLERNGR